MKRLLTVLFAFVVVIALASCAPATPQAGAGSEATPTGNPEPRPMDPGADQPTQQPTAQPTAEPTAEPTQAPAGSSPAVDAAIAKLIEFFGFSREQITVVSQEEVEWNDACLGVSQPDVLCAQVITPGYQIILDVDGRAFEMHTNLDGSMVQAAFLEPRWVQDAVARVLADQLGITLDEVKVVSIRPMQWPNACLGIETPETACAEVITPGYAVVVEANDVQYEYRTNLDLSQILPATVGLSWSREGGIAGFDDQLVVHLPGQVSANGRTGQLADLLPAAEAAKLAEWLNTYGKVELSVEDPATADAMKTTLTLMGAGTQQPTQAEQQAMLEWAQNLFNQLAK